MSVALVLATLSALSVAIMVQLDRVMVGACYNFRPRLAWHVSAIGGIGFGLPLTFGFGWLLDEDYLSFVWYAALTPDAFIVFIAGFLAIQVMKYYFELFVPRVGESVNETGIAMWLATTPLWVFCTLELGAVFGLGVTNASQPWLTFPLVLLTVGAIVIFESLGKQKSLATTKGLTIMKMIACVVGYSLILDVILDEKTLLETLVLQPFFWLGYALGARDLLFKSGRDEWRSAKLRLRYFFKVILVAELFGALVFYFEVLAYFELGATAINLVSAGAVLPTFMLSILLGGTMVSDWVRRAHAKKERYLGVLVDPTDLPDNEVTGVKIGWLLIVIGLLVLTIATL